MNKNSCIHAYKHTENKSQEAVQQSDQSGCILGVTEGQRWEFFFFYLILLKYSTCREVHRQCIQLKELFPILNIFKCTV